MLVAPHLVPCCLSCTVVCHGWASRRFAMPSPSPVLCHVFHAVVYEAVVPHRSPCPYQSSLVACRRSRVSAVGHDVRARLTRTYDITSTSSRHLSTIVWRRHSRGANFFTFSFLYLRVSTSHPLIALASCYLFHQYYSTGVLPAGLVRHPNTIPHPALGSAVTALALVPASCTDPTHGARPLA
jgi:hypothetical protein